MTGRRTEADGPENPEFVLLKPGIWISDGADNLRFDVGLSSNVVDHVTINWIVEQAVDREVPSQNILLRICKHHARGAPPVDVRLI